MNYIGGINGNLTNIKSINELEDRLEVVEKKTSSSATQEDLVNEISARTNADNELKTAITAEIGRAVGAEEKLQTNIDEIASKISTITILPFTFNCIVDKMNNTYNLYDIENIPDEVITQIKENINKIVLMEDNSPVYIRQATSADAIILYDLEIGRTQINSQIDGAVSQYLYYQLDETNKKLIAYTKKVDAAEHSHTVTIDTSQYGSAAEGTIDYFYVTDEQLSQIKKYPDIVLCLSTSGEYIIDSNTYLFKVCDTNSVNILAFMSYSYNINQLIYVYEDGDSKQFNVEYLDLGGDTSAIESKINIISSNLTSLTNRVAALENVLNTEF
jgi:uncharacterized protein YlzI (FlbEa/FlbD family)